MTYDIGPLHHVGLIVRDMAATLDLYRRLGFDVSPPSYPTMARQEGSEPEAFGAANTHADFANNFVELATYVGEGSTAKIPAGARLVPLEAPPDVLPILLERIDRTSADLAKHLDRFEGLHILMFSSADIDETAERLLGVGARHGGINELRRPVEIDGETTVEMVRYLELEDTPEGRVGVALDLGADSINQRSTPSHPNGAVDLVDVLLCIADEDLADACRRYEGYLDQTARRDGSAHVIPLEHGTVTLVGQSHLEELLPGEHAPEVPALVAYTVGVSELSSTEELLRAAEFPVRQALGGKIFVPATEAGGAAVCFRGLG